MFKHSDIPLPPPVSDSLRPARSSGWERDRLRATLRLVFSADDADALVAPVAGAYLDADDLRRVAERAGARYRLLRWVARLRRQVGPDPPPLGPHAPCSPQAALALALHLGLRANVDALSGVLQRDTPLLAADLHAARRSLSPALGEPCPAVRHLVPLYRDPDLAPGERIALLTHLRACEPCRALVDTAQEIDATLLARVDASEAALPPLAPARRAPAAAPWLPLAGVALLLVALVVTSMAVPALRSRSSAPSPLLAPAVDAPVTGWLLISTVEGTLQASNLATGERRDIGDTVGRPAGQRFLTPDGSRIASWYWPAANPRTNVVRVTALDGTLLSEIDWHAPGSRRFPAGWLTDTQLLVVEHAQHHSGESEAQYTARAELESRLLAVDTLTGDERVLATGFAMSAALSPLRDRLLTMHVTRPAGRGLSLSVREIHSAGTGAGPPRVVLEDGFSVEAGFAWAADGATLVAARNLTERTWSPPGDRPAPWESDTVPRELLALHLGGDNVRLVTVPQGMALRVVGITQDGHALYVLGDWSFDRIRYALWSVALDGASEPVRIADLPGEPGGWGSGALQSPDGSRFLLQTTQPHYLIPDSRERALGDVLTTAYLSIAPDGQLLAHEIALSIGGAAVAWLPDGALPEHPPAGATHIASLEHGTVSTVRLWHELHASSGASADGNYVVLTDTEARLPIVWETTRRSGRRLLGDARDIAWVDHEAALIAVTGEVGRSRIALFDTRLFTSTRMYDYRHFDPANLGEIATREYARPLVSPDGTRTIFFVLDHAAGRIELWVASWNGSAQELYSWTMPSDRGITPPMVALWVERNALVFVEPTGWEQGFPTFASLQRLSFDADGPVLDDVAALHGRGADRGFVISEVALSSDHLTLAWRSRHYPTRGNRGAYDTVRIAPSSDISQEIELGRGRTTGTAWNERGLSWAPSRTWLAYEVGGSVHLASHDARVTVTLAQAGRAPLWVRNDELWYAQDAPPGSRIMRVSIAWRLLAAE
jgi:hypothetical protein